MVRGTIRIPPKPSEREQTIESIIEAAKTILDRTGSPININAENLKRELGKLPNYRIIYSYYGLMKEEIWRKYDLKVSYIALIRADATGQRIDDHPLIKAKKVYPNFQPGSQDWQRDVNIPTEIGIEEAELLGIILADVALVNGTRRGTVRFAGRRNLDNDFYETIVSPRIEEVFNIQAPVFYFKGTPTILINSKAIKTWLTYDLGFNDVEKILKWLPEKRQQIAFFEGYFAGKCAIGKYGKMHEKVSNKQSILEQIFNLAQSLGIECKLKKWGNNTVLCFSWKEMSKIHMLNPYHQEKLKDRSAPTVRSPKPFAIAQDFF